MVIIKTGVLLSGGVDSSVTLALLKEREYELTAFYLKIWFEDELSFLGECPWDDDLRYARAVCEQVGVELKIIPLQTEYFAKVVEYTISELKAGRTPSPDILCNQHIKFGAFFDSIGEDYDKVASGHYAQIEEAGGKFLLKKAPDPVKDQTYFLSNLNQSQLSRLLFPIGHLHKNEVRALAAKFNLPNMSRKDSQGICFLGKINYPDFVRAYLGQKQGAIIEQETNRKLGEHQGYWFYTIGQRRGLGLHGGPWFVIEKDIRHNIIYVSHKDSVTLQAKNRFDVTNMNWIAGKPDKYNLQVKIRHSPHFDECQIREESKNRFTVSIANEEQGIAPGQSAVFYDGDICLGGGIITIHTL